MAITNIIFQNPVNFGEKPGDLFCETLTWETPEFLKPQPARIYEKDAGKGEELPGETLNLNEMLKSFEEKGREFDDFVHELNHLHEEDEEQFQTELERKEEFERFSLWIILHSNALLVPHERILLSSSKWLL